MYSISLHTVSEHCCYQTKELSWIIIILIVMHTMAVALSTVLNIAAYSSGSTRGGASYCIIEGAGVHNMTQRRIVEAQR